MTSVFSAASLLMRENSSASSSLERTAEGSSRMRMRGFSARALAISTICWWDTLRWETRVRTSRCGNPRSSRIERARRLVPAQSTHTRPAPRVGILPMRMFSAMVRWRTRLNSWCTARMPMRFASCGVPSTTVLPSIAIVPESGVTAPESMFMSVDLPAPFSPTTAWTSPSAADRETFFSAIVPPNFL